MGSQFVYPTSGPLPNPREPETLTVSFWRRAITFWIDGTLIGFATGALDRLARAFPQWPAWGWIVGILSWLVAPVYYIWAYSTNGQTPGKKWLGIKVVSIDGSALTWRKGVLRFLGYLLSDLSFLLGYLWSIWDQDKQAWHDKIAGTRVVPASASDEQVRVVFNQMQLRKRSGAWKWAAGAMVGLELAVVPCLVIAYVVTPKPQLHEDEWVHFGDALFARVNPDPAIANFHLTRFYNWPARKITDVWLEMDMELPHDADCEADDTSDRCYRLANELVKTVFDNYPHIDEIRGIHVVMTKKAQIGSVELEQTPVDEALTINEWRQMLSSASP